MSDDEPKQEVNETVDKEKEEAEDVGEEGGNKSKEEKVENKEEEETKKDEEPKKEEEEKKEQEQEPKTELEPEPESKPEPKPDKEEVTETPKKSDVPLYDQPLEMSGKRDRKKVERFVQETKKEEVKTTGSGIPLGEIPFIEAMIMKMPVDDLKVLHRVAYSRPGSGSEVKKNLRKFNGFPFTKEDKKHQSKLSTVERLFMSEIKKMLMILGLERSGNKSEVVERLMEFMLKPHDAGRKPPKTPKKGKGRGRPKKGQEKKRRNNTSMDDSGSGGSESNESESEELESDEEDIDEKPKKTPGKKTPAKKTPAKRAGAAAKKATSAKRSRTADSDDSDSDDEPLSKKVKQPPSDGELKVMVKKILEGANLEEVTMKSVCRQVYDKYPDFDLTHKKDFIKETVKSIIS